MNEIEKAVILICIIGAFLAPLKELKLIVSIVWITISRLTFLKVIFCICGLIISPIILLITSNLVYNEKLKVPNRLRITASDITDAVFEEIIWRDVIIYFFITNMQNDEISIIVIVLIYLSMFVLMHRFEGIKKYIEAYFYSFVVFMVALMFPGMHYGLHIGRNIYIESAIFCQLFEEKDICE